MQVIVRSPAIIWWKSLSSAQRAELVENFYPHAEKPMTISQIEQIHKTLTTVIK
jgi:hypothetical protein